jgi:tetrahydromethanopterin S-methyltransferase subunit G
MAITIPWYIGHENNVEAQLEKVTEDLWYSFTTISEVYQREGQQVGRKICMIRKK